MDEDDLLGLQGRQVSEISRAWSNILNLGVYEYTYTYPLPPLCREGGQLNLSFDKLPTYFSSSCEAVCLVIVFFEMHCVPSSLNFYALHVGYLVGT